LGVKADKGRAQADKSECLRDIEQHQVADQTYMRDGVRLLELAGGAQRLFKRQSNFEKRQLLEFVISNLVWKNGELAVKIGELLGGFTPAECANYFKNSGYAST
jgi:hypothetical protein